MTSASPSSPLAADWRTRMGDEPFTERTPRIVTAAKLHRAAARRKVGRFLAEGSNAVGSALRHGTVVEVDLNRGAHLVKFDSMPTPRAISFKAKLEREP